MFCPVKFSGAEHSCSTSPVCSHCPLSIEHNQLSSILLASTNILSGTVLYFTVLFFTVLSCSLLYCPVLHYPVMSCILLSCTTLSCPVLSCPVMPCSADCHNSVPSILVSMVASVPQFLIVLVTGQTSRDGPIKGCLTKYKVVASL